MNVTHIANPNLSLRVVTHEQSKYFPYSTVAVLTNDEGAWYSADLIEHRGQTVAAAVNMYGDKSTAVRDAARRIGE